jgi:hypothetical protein
MPVFMAFDCLQSVVPAEVHLNAEVMRSGPPDSLTDQGREVEYSGAWRVGPVVRRW